VKEKCCFCCAHRVGFICYGLKLKTSTPINLKKLIGEKIVKKEEDLKKHGKKCMMFNPIYWSVS